MGITVIGTGYFRAVHAAGIAELGYDVLGVDVDERRSSRLPEGEAPFPEPDLPELLNKGLNSVMLLFTTSLEKAAEFGDAHFICVGTPDIERWRNTAWTMRAPGRPER